MRFGKTLKSSVYQPWESYYIDYGALKLLLRENDPEDESREWTEDDEGKFVEELINVQLERVNGFHNRKYQDIRDRTSECEAKLQELENAEGGQELENAEGGAAQDREKDQEKDEKNQNIENLNEVLHDLDRISREISELEKYSRINFTGFLKAAKKHDRKRGHRYKVRPLLQVRLAALPFNSEDYSPLLYRWASVDDGNLYQSRFMLYYRLSSMYTFARLRTDGNAVRTKSLTSNKDGKDTYTSHKFWVHSENLLEVKTYILRRLPVLVYNPQTSKIVESSQSDPSITSLYFDNPKFELYYKKLERNSNASSLRLRWSGQLQDKPEVFLEKKTIEESGDSQEIRFPIKEKYIQPFIKGEYKMEKTVEKLRDREGTEGNGVANLEKSVDEIQQFIRENELQPVLRSNYTRTAFQVPGDDNVRISIDTDVTFIREDSLDVDRPCRSPEDWHRGDIDRLNIKHPFTEIRQGEISRFPHALLEIKVRDGASKRTNGWVSDLMSSHLVKEAPRFSKFVHGVAQLFDDSVNSFPFWLSDLETDIRRDPEAAFQEEQEKKARQAEDEMAVGSFLGSKKSIPSFKAAIGSPVGKAAADFGKRRSPPGVEDVVAEADSDDETDHVLHPATGMFSGLFSSSPFSASKYARAHRQGSVELPPGVQVPQKFIKDMNPVRVEPKVWLANERTFIKWQHISVLLASLSLGLFNAAGADNRVAQSLAVVYTIVALFAGAWGWWISRQRSKMIEKRSGKDFDAIAGPIVVCIGLCVALCLNFGLKYRSATAQSTQRSNISHELGTSDTISNGLNDWRFVHQDFR
ncbi:Phosphate metabolism transcription protein [Lecanora helva]